MMISKFFRHCLLLAAFVFYAAPALATSAITVMNTQLRAVENGLVLDAQFNFELNENLVNTVTRGVPLYFTTEFELISPHWYWFDEKVIETSQTVKLSYQPLIREYRVSNDGGGLQAGFTSLQDALVFVRNVRTWHVSDKLSNLEPGVIYKAAIRMHLDIALLAKPLRINAFNNQDWDMSSDWKYFRFSLPIRSNKK